MKKLPKRVIFKKYSSKYEIDADTLYERLLDINNRQCAVKPSWNTFWNERNADFLKECITWTLEKNYLNLFTFEIDENIIAYRIGFYYNNIFYDWNTCFDPKYFGISSGKLLMVKIIEHIFDDGYEEFDFMRGNEWYKQKWATGSRKNLQICAYPISIRGKINYFAVNKFRRWLSSSKMIRYFKRRLC